MLESGRTRVGLARHPWHLGCDWSNRSGDSKATPPPAKEKFTASQRTLLGGLGGAQRCLPGGGGLLLGNDQVVVIVQALVDVRLHVENPRPLLPDVVPGMPGDLIPGGEPVGFGIHAGI